MWAAAALAPPFGALEADAAAQLAPIWGIERSQLRADWHRLGVPSIFLSPRYADLARPVHGG